TCIALITLFSPSLSQPNTEAIISTKISHRYLYNVTQRRHHHPTSFHKQRSTAGNSQRRSPSVSCQNTSPSKCSRPLDTEPVNGRSTWTALKVQETPIKGKVVAAACQEEGTHTKRGGWGVAPYPPYPGS
ncbi:unnamed protein product, partial [Ectocarpus sp. 12 AP-2014]